jgi:signal transduction histidine kinase
MRHEIIWGKNDEFYDVMKQRDADLRADLVAGLVFINAGVLVFGVMASYFLARVTLRPIDDAMQAQSRFVSDASHELRTPLSAIIMENEVLLRDKKPADKELKTQVSSNLAEARKLQLLTDRLLKLSRNEPLELSKIDVLMAASEALTHIQPAAKSKQITIKNHLKSHIITADADTLTEVLAILLDNAVKYSPQKSTIIIGQKHGRLFVRDEGPGIADADLPHVFERFYRAEKSRTSDGCGLGLSLAQNLAQQMNMKVAAENNSGPGATFWIW